MSKVYFFETDLENFERNPKVLVNFLDTTEAFSRISKKDIVGIKIHFGEDKNQSYIKPHYIKNLVEKIKRLGAYPLLFDTNTLYGGKRSNAVDHFKLAFFEHNFGMLKVPIIIADGLKGNDYIEVDTEGKHFKKAKVASLLRDLDFMLALSHLTGHMLTGFGASMKNIGMGCASKAGKMEQHCEVSPKVKQDICILCGQCIAICPQGAIRLKDNKIFINQDKCTGCAQCLSQCPKAALKIVWSENCPLLQEKMVEYTKAALKLCPRSFFVNFSIFITKECDCMNQERKGAAKDLGILASQDILALDKATVDLVNKLNIKDVFEDFHENVNYNPQFKHASLLGLGSIDYQIEEFSYEKKA